MNVSVYMPDNAETKIIMDRVEVLQKMYRASFSELVVEGLKLLVSQNKTSNKKPDFRTPELGA
jgi:hypothetical protein